MRQKPGHRWTKEKEEEDKRAAQGVSLYQAQSNAQEEVLGQDISSIYQM